MQKDLSGLIKNLISTDVVKSIVYAHTKDLAWRIYHLLQMSVANKACVGLYHANLTRDLKLSIYRIFCNNSSSIKCLVATVAFGMVSNDSET